MILKKKEQQLIIQLLRAEITRYEDYIKNGKKQQAWMRSIYGAKLISSQEKRIEQLKDVLKHFV